MQVVRILQSRHFAEILLLKYPMFLHVAYVEVKVRTMTIIHPRRSPTMNRCFRTARFADTTE